MTSDDNVAAAVVLSLLQSGTKGPAGVLRRATSLARRKKTGTLGFLILIIVIAAAIFGPMLSPYSKDQLFTKPNPTYDPNGFTKESFSRTTTQVLERPSLEHPFGTDPQGRDLMTRVFLGGRVSLTVGVLSALLAVAFGTLIGVVSGYFGGLIDIVTQRIVDSMMAVPGLVFLVLLVQVRAPSTGTTISALAVLGAWGASRLVRASVLAVKAEMYVGAAQSIGASSARIIAWHVLPNVLGMVIIAFSVSIGANILAEAGLSFLGFGLPGPTWGKMVSEARTFIAAKPIMSIVSGGAITLTVLGFSLVGDAVRDVLDPRQRGN